MDLRDIVKKWLSDNGYDGLYNFECGCVIDDLMPCGAPEANCLAGYRRPGGQAQEYDFVIGQKIAEG